VELGRAVTDARDIEDLKRLGAGRPAPEGVAALYREAFRTFGAAALWSRTPRSIPPSPRRWQSPRAFGGKATGDRLLWRRESKRPAAPPSNIQGETLSLLAAHRNPESYVARASALNRDGPRFSGDIDIFHDREESVAEAADADAALLVDNGFAVQWLRRPRRGPRLRAVHARRQGRTRLSGRRGACTTRP
jgi:hypothetical protein